MSIQTFGSMCAVLVIGLLAHSVSFAGPESAAEEQAREAHDGAEFDGAPPAVDSQSSSVHVVEESAEEEASKYHDGAEFKDAPQVSGAEQGGTSPEGVDNAVQEAKKSHDGAEF